MVAELAVERITPIGEPAIECAILPSATEGLAHATNVSFPPELPIPAPNPRCELPLPTPILDRSPIIGYERVHDDTSSQYCTCR